MIRSKSIRKAVEEIHEPTRSWLKLRVLLPRLARDRHSRLSSIRDVVLYMLPDYLPDPRRHLADVIAADTAAHEEFLLHYAIAGPHLRGDRDRIAADFPRLPAAIVDGTKVYHKIKFHSGFITIVGSNGAVTYRDRVPIRVFDHGDIQHAGYDVFYDGRTRKFAIGSNSYNSLYGTMALPCGLLIAMSQSSATVINPITGESRVVREERNYCSFDDYGNDRLYWNFNVAIGARSWYYGYVSY